MTEAACVLILVGWWYEPGRLFAFLAAGALLTAQALRAWSRGNRWPAVGVAAMIAAFVGLAVHNARAIRALRDLRRSPPPFVDGVRRGEAEGLRGPIRVSVDVRGGRIVDLRIVSCADSPSIAGEALERTRRRIVEEGTPRVRPAPGARVSTAALCRAVEEALWSARKGASLGGWDALLMRLETNEPRRTTFGTLVLVVVALSAGLRLRRRER